ncbi:AAA family ATPase [Psychrobacillus sp. FSL H8-0484]|uniref:AAA family ATPase n=1 Tax=Psychrobacillus sp. FSL H8-0484 TaxID=2921390 RepID=UPI0030FC88E8
MERTLLEKALLKDHYIDISFRRYLDFKKTPTYEEAYKLEVLTRLNEFMDGLEINEFNVVDVVKKIQKENPQSGSFVHWSGPTDLVKFAEARSTEMADLMNHLYDATVPVTERIEKFRESGKEFDPKISLGSPLFGYLLAAFNYKKYPLYKEEVFKDLKKSFGIDEKLGLVQANYEMYFTMCEIVFDYLKGHYPELTMLDIQDFFFCCTQYDEIKVETAVEYLFGMAKEIHYFKNHIEEMLKAISEISPVMLKASRDKYRNQEKIKQIRFQILDKLIENGSLGIAELEEIKERVSTKYDTNILKSWSNFFILFELYYINKKTKVKEEQRKIHEAVQRFKAYEGKKFVDGKVLNGFNWNQHFGGSECWLAVYEEKYSSHRFAPQFFVSINEEQVRYGLLHGDQHPKRGAENIEKVFNNEEFTFERFKKKMEESLNSLEDSDVVVEETEDYIQEISVETWMELLQNDEVFFESDLVYLQKIIELGGEVKVTQTAASLGGQPPSFSTQVVELAKRVMEDLKFQPILTDVDEANYWRILFDDEYEEKNHIIWEIKPNLKEALEVSNDAESKIDLPVYDKEDFLREVFIDETQYDTISNLLHYKKNIILQGPPGVGKTFVSRRLAYSLMGQRDESHVEMVQFHQNYAYEDFVMGYRPNLKGSFALQTGIFYDFCDKALENPEKDYYFIIDEINRGNLSKIFGELFMLIERDKRDDFVTMGYSKEPFTVPSNVYLIGTMNTADRSLAQLDVALRRRFAFVSLMPSFNEKWKEFMLNHGVSLALVERILSAVDKWNKEIIADFQLGSDYAIGHSFFTTLPEGMDEMVWFNGIVEYEIKPLLGEYFFDRPEIVGTLLEGI